MLFPDLPPVRELRLCLGTMWSCTGNAELCFTVDSAAQNAPAQLCCSALGSQYTLKHVLHMQIPNFVLATPILCLSVTGCYEYVSQDWTRTVQLGLLPPCAGSSLGSKPQLRKGAGKMHSHTAKTKTCANESRGFYSADTAPYVHQWAIMTACALLVMNVQVATRCVTQPWNAFRFCQSAAMDLQTWSLLCHAGSYQHARQFIGMRHPVSSHKGPSGFGDTFSPTSA